jgi:hypothetical protein
MRKLATALVATAAAATVLATAAPAQAQPNTTTVIVWTGTNCIQVASAYTYSPQAAGISTICGGSWEFSEGNIWPGDLFGADPIMGDATYIECAVFAGGRLVWSDSAHAGDGTDVNCLREAIV